jgi:hypothetical protein
MKDNVLKVRHNLNPVQVVEALREIEISMLKEGVKPEIKLHEFTINKDFKRDLSEPMIIEFIRL